MTRKATKAYFCSLMISALGAANCFIAQAEDKTLLSMPPAMRNVLIWDQDDSGHMVDVKAAKTHNANVVNVAAVPHNVGTWIGSVKPLAAYEKGLNNNWKAD